MEREFTAQKVRNKLHATEAAVEAAIRQAGELLAEMYAAKAEFGLAATVGAEETARTARAVAALSLAHEELVGTHRRLEVLGRALKLRIHEDSSKPEFGVLARVLEMPAMVAA